MSADKRKKEQEVIGELEKHCIKQDGLMRLTTQDEKTNICGLSLYEQNNLLNCEYLGETYGLLWSDGKTDKCKTCKYEKKGGLKE